MFKFFKTPKHQRYEYRPRFFDPEKEEREERIETLLKAKEGDTNAIKKRISTGLRGGGYIDKSNVRRQSLWRMNMILLGLILLLGGVAVYFVQFHLSDLVEKFL